MSAAIIQCERILRAVAGCAAVAEYDGRHANDAKLDDETAHLSDNVFDDYLSDEPIPDCF